MSYAVMRGTPTAAQLYLDTIMEELVAETGRRDDRYCLNKIVYKCIRDNPNDIRLIEGGSGEINNNRTVLERSVRAALALQNEGLHVGDAMMIISRNSLEMSSIYFGGIFAGVVLFVLPPIVIAHELKHFLKILKVKMIFTEIEILHTIEEALEEYNLNINIVLFGQNSSNKSRSFKEFTSGFDDQVETFRPADTDRDSSVLVLPTSGSTGLPKAAVWNNQGMVAQLPAIWANNIKFPRPTDIIMCTSNASWATFAISMMSSAVFGVALLTTAAQVTTEHIRMLLRKYKPTVTTISVSTGAALMTEPGHLEGDLSSFEVIYLCGSAVPQHLLEAVQRHLQPGARASNLYGLTEMQGCAVMPKPESPTGCLGTVINQLDFKIVDEQGNKLGPHKAGELWLKSEHCAFKEYVNNERATKDAFEDGWYKTGDKVYMNENEELFFVERIKFIFKYQGYHISPSELEEVITKVEGVNSAAVCNSPKGPAAMVVTIPGMKITFKNVHDAVTSTLSDVKRLRGGVAFVEAIPLLANGKIDRNKVKKLFEEIKEDQIYYDN